MTYINFCALRCLKGELSWAIDKWLWVISNINVSNTTKKLKNKAILNLKQYCIRCYVILSNVFQLMHMKMCIHYSTKNLLANYKLCLCFYCDISVNPAWYDCLIFVGFVRFLIIYEVFYTWCLRYNIRIAWFLDIRISPCYCIYLKILYAN